VGAKLSPLPGVIGGSASPTAAGAAKAASPVPAVIGVARTASINGRSPSPSPAAAGAKK
jgi:hypothetical protein